VKKTKQGREDLACKCVGYNDAKAKEAVAFQSPSENLGDGRGTRKGLKVWE